MMPALTAMPQVLQKHISAKAGQTTELFLKKTVSGIM